ncbi:CesT family type III secretion system chaperone [Pseudothauera rhizosphaerae]|nr:CesT family type III secretion system chaperone [Pseudothauera rhizosphaerae]
MSTVSLPAGLAALSTRFAIDPGDWEASGRLELRVDRYPRVSLRRGPARQIELEARLAALPALAQEREALVDRLMLRVTAGAARQIGVPVLAPDGGHLLLQAALDGEDARAFEDGLEAFLNDLDYWAAALGERS